MSRQNDRSDSDTAETERINRHRRKFLSVVGAGVTVGLAGCSSGGDGGDGSGGGGDGSGDGGSSGSSDGGDGSGSDDDSVDQTETPPSTEEAPSEPTGQIVLSQTYDPTGLDPAKYTNITDMQIANNIFDALVNFKIGSTEIGPGLATDWSLTNDGTSLEMTLREGVQFHKDYGELTAADVEAHFERMNDSDTGSPVKATLDQTGYQGVETMDDYNFRLNFSQPATVLPFLLAQQMGMIPSADAVDDKGDDFSFDPVGAGPFEFDRFEPQTETVLTAFDDYYRDEQPKVERAIYRPIPESQTAWSSFRSQEIDIKRVNSAERLKSLKQRDFVKITQTVGLITRFAGINTQVEPFTNKKVRQALNYASNNKAVVEEVFPGLSELAGSFMAPDVKHHTAEGVPQYPYDPEQAQTLLEEAGYGDGFETTWWVPDIGRFTKPATVFQENWAQIGIDVEIQVKETGSYVGRIFQGPHEVPLFIHSLGQDPVPDFFMFEQFHSDAFPPDGSNFWLYENEQVDEWLDQATTSTDEEERAELFAKAERQIAEDAPGIWIDHERFIFPIQDYVKGFVSDPMRRMELETTWVDK